MRDSQFFHAQLMGVKVINDNTLLLVMTNLKVSLHRNKPLTRCVVSVNSVFSVAKYFQ